MAKTVMLKHRTSGLIKTGYFGFSWTTLFFGFLPALFRGDFVTFLVTFAVCMVLGFITLGVGSFIFAFVWAFFYNRYYTRRLMEMGYEVADNDTQSVLARQQLGVA